MYEKLVMIIRMFLWYIFVFMFHLYRSLQSRTNNYNKLAFLGDGEPILSNSSLNCNLILHCANQIKKCHFLNCNSSSLSCSSTICSSCNFSNEFWCARKVFVKSIWYMYAQSLVRGIVMLENLMLRGPDWRTYFVIRAMWYWFSQFSLL